MPAIDPPAPVSPPARPPSAATARPAPPIPSPPRPPSTCSSAADRPSMPPSPPMPASASSSPPAPASAAIASPSSGIQSLAKSSAWPAPAAPRKSLTLETVRARAVNGSHSRRSAPSAVSTPGALDGWWALHQRYGKLKWAELFEPAIHSAKPATPTRRSSATTSSATWRRFSAPTPASKKPPTPCTPTRPAASRPTNTTSAAIPTSRAPTASSPRAAATPSTTAPSPHTIDAYFKRIGGWLSAEDLREHHAEWVEPLVTNYRGVDVYGMPANTQGLATLQMLNIIENFDLRGWASSRRRLHPRAGRSQAPRLRRPRPLLRRSALRKNSHRLAQLEGLRKRTRQAHQARQHPHPRLSRPGAQPRRHHLLLHRRLRRHDGLP